MEPAVDRTVTFVDVDLADANHFRIGEGSTTNLAGHWPQCLDIQSFMVAMSLLAAVGTVVEVGMDNGSVEVFKKTDDFLISRTTVRPIRSASFTAAVEAF